MNQHDAILAAIAGKITPVVRRYHGNRLAEEVPVGSGGAWECSVSGDRDLTVTFKLITGTAESTGVGVGFEFSDWSPKNYVLLPAAVYDGNNFAVMNTKYPPLWRDRAEFRADMPTTIVPSPRLGPGSNRIEQTTGDTAAPCMGFYSPGLSHGFLLVTEQGSRFGNHGLTVEARGGGARFLVTAPCVREFRQAHCAQVPSDDRGVSWKVGDSITLKFRIECFPVTNLQALFDRFCEVRKSSLNPSVRREELPFSAGWKIVEEKYNRDNWVEAHGYYKLAPNAHTTFEVAENPLCFLWQIGWVGGGMMTLPMLAQGSEETRRRTRRNLDMIFDKTQAPSGFFYGIGDGEKFYGDGFDRPHPHRLHMVRKSGDWLYFAIKHLDFLQKQGAAVPAGWPVAIRKLADAFVRLWERSGQFGQFVDVETGELLVGGSASGAIIPGALALASEFFKEPKYRAVADAAARKYYEKFVQRGITTGGPGEILSAPDSESAFGMVESFVTLLELTGDAFWEKASKEMVRQAATWVVSYDHRFPSGSSLEQSGARSTGAVWANIQNKHGAPGICTFSGDSLLRLWRLTGDPLALDLLRDIAHGIPQYLSRTDRPLSPQMSPGWMCERVNLSDWEEASGVGGNLFGSCSWTETALMLTTLEIPGLYVQPDTGFFCAFDNIEVTRVCGGAGKVVLKLANSTKFDAAVKVFSETSEQARQPLRLNAWMGWQAITIPAGATRDLEFS